jgi:hypothetical protein
VAQCVSLQENTFKNESPLAQSASPTNANIAKSWFITPKQIVK